MHRGRIIFLNGTSSSGKSTLAKNIQKISKEKFFHVQIDTFCDMLHQKFFDSDFSETENSVASLMHKFVVFLSDEGQNVIVDTVIENHHENWLRECVTLMEFSEVIFVKVSCPPEELEKRELERGDRTIGQAIGQYKNMYFNDIYDFEINTFENTPDECAKIVIDKMKSFKIPDSAFFRLRKKYLNF
ncbi:MAG TPA: AAA family ATPase [Petrotogaceae bacterium]|jgi:chloramphenicol 3-O-phosphotransferase|nr:AAA family ATPase [Petrotogaceae bacterium]HQF34035.1 AAA family ATPase [Petrotogaceae bacterium]HQO12433.1 AAA family ATPase [Petrotogaceae bacterium]HQP57348.1 AAA family ATPase [Petrotogaceae bacterium]